jgi:hypothetical protein
MPFVVDDLLVIALLGLCRAAYASAASDADRAKMKKKNERLEEAVKKADMQTVNVGKQLKTDLAVAHALLESKTERRCMDEDRPCPGHCRHKWSGWPAPARYVWTAQQTGLCCIRLSFLINIPTWVVATVSLMAIADYHRFTSSPYKTDEVLEIKLNIRYFSCQCAGRARERALSCILTD